MIVKCEKCNKDIDINNWSFKTYKKHYCKICRPIKLIHNLICKNCGKDFSGRNGQLFCQVKCCQHYFKKINKKSIKINNIKYREDNKEKISVYRKEYSKNNKKKISVYKKEYLSKNREKICNYRYFKKYGITIIKYKEMLKNQDNKCAICSREIFLAGGTELKSKVGYVDHDHKTGKVRKLLCSFCNTGLGLFQDNINFLENAKQYLINSNK